MKRTTYTRYSGELANDMDLEDLMQQLSDYLRDSGFQDPMSRFQEFDGEHSLDNLREALSGRRWSRVSLSGRSVNGLIRCPQRARWSG